MVLIGPPRQQGKSYAMALEAAAAAAAGLKIAMPPHRDALAHISAQFGIARLPYENDQDFGKRIVVTIRGGGVRYTAHIPGMPSPSPDPRALPKPATVEEGLATLAAIGRMTHREMVTVSDKLFQRAEPDFPEAGPKVIVGAFLKAAKYGINHAYRVDTHSHKC